MNAITDIFGNPPVMTMGNYEFQEVGKEIFQSGLNPFMEAVFIVYAASTAGFLILGLITRK